MKHGSIITPRPRHLSHLRSRTKAGTFHPQPVNWFVKPPDGDLLGNDDYGDCDPVADFRLIQKWGGQCSKELALNRYTQLTGFSRNDPATDQGTDTNADMMSWCAFPIFDGGRAWPIYWAAIESTDYDQIHRALQRFPLLITIVLPKAVEQNPELWRGMPGGSSGMWEPTEPHRVLLGGWDGSYWTIETWGMHVPVSEAMMELMLTPGCVDVAIPHPDVAPDALNLDGIDFASLEIDLAAMGITTNAGKDT